MNSHIIMKEYIKQELKIYSQNDIFLRSMGNAANEAGAQPAGMLG